MFVGFLPGYTLMKLLFLVKPIQSASASTKEYTEQTFANIDALERFALSIGLSMALTSIIGLMLNYTPWGIGLATISLSLLSLTMVLATLALIREYSETIKFNA